MKRFTHTTWLSEQLRGGLSAAASIVASVLVIKLSDAGTLTVADGCVLALFTYLLVYLLVTMIAFSVATRDEILQWARREDRGTFWQRYVLGTAPGPGVSLFIASAAMAVAVVWLPDSSIAEISEPVRLLVAVGLVSVAWVCVVVSYAVTFHADNLLEDERGLDFPGDEEATWRDYVYFAVSVMTTFGTTDVTVSSARMRQTVTVNAVIAFVFNTVTVATLVSQVAAI